MPRIAEREERAYVLGGPLGVREPTVPPIQLGQENSAAQPAVNLPAIVGDGFGSSVAGSFELPDRACRIAQSVAAEREVLEHEVARRHRIGLEWFEERNALCKSPLLNAQLPKAVGDCVRRIGKHAAFPTLTLDPFGIGKPVRPDQSHELPVEQFEMPAPR
jgi:hypothetical protein